MRSILYSLLILSNLCSAEQVFDCKSTEPRAGKIYQELSQNNTAGCIYSNIDTHKTTVSFYKKNKHDFSVIDSNSKLIEAFEVIPNIEQIGRGEFQIMYYYPRDTYAITVGIYNSSIKIINAYRTIRVNNSPSSEEQKTLTFNLDSAIVNGLVFSKINEDSVFNGENLELSKESFGEAIKISSERAYLYSSSDNKEKTKSYLIEGDLIKVLDYKSGFLFVSYTNGKGKTIKRWLPLSDVL